MATSYASSSALGSGSVADPRIKYGSADERLSRAEEGSPESYKPTSRRPRRLPLWFRRALTQKRVWLYLLALVGVYLVGLHHFSDGGVGDATNTLASVLSAARGGSASLIGGLGGNGAAPGGAAAAGAASRREKQRQRKEEKAREEAAAALREKKLQEIKEKKEQKATGKSTDDQQVFDTTVVLDDGRAPLPEAVVMRNIPDHPVVEGHLQVNPESTMHPIYQLIRDARLMWDQKTARQSKTLKEAVAEYRRRYKIDPPPGFDKWWHYVVKNKVKLPDEYDQILKDLTPFRAFRPEDVRSTIEKGRKAKDTYTLDIKDGKVSWTFTHDDKRAFNMRREGQVDLIEDVVQDLPDMTVVYTVHDTPFITIPYSYREKVAEYIQLDETMKPEQHKIQYTEKGFAAMCSTGSKVRTDGVTPLEMPNGTVPSKSFISNHVASMDLCNNPNLVHLHGLFAGKNPNANDMSAIFAISKTAIHADVLGVPPERVGLHVSPVPWEEKTRERLLWRGTNTGLHYGAKIPWRDTHRVRLTGLGDEKTGQTTILTPPRQNAGKRLEDSAKVLDKGAANEHYMDMAFTGKPHQCEVEDGTCAEIAEKYPFRPRVEVADADRSKYIVDVDGNAWSARFQRLMASGSLIFKSTVMPEWWNDRIQPWVHYIPLKVDYSDLYDSLAFFRGDLNSVGGEDALARQIATEGRDWSNTHYRREDMTAYVFRLYLEWARLQSDERKKSFVYEEGMEMVRVD